MLEKLKLKVAFQLIKRHSLIAPFLPAGYRPYSFSGGKIFLDLRESKMMLKRYFNQYEVPMRSVLEKKLSAGCTFIDVGASKGDFALIAARIVGDRGRVLAFEPEPENCVWIRESIALNNYSNITLFEMALADSNEQAQLYLGDTSGWHSLVPGLENRTKGVISVSKRRLDDVLAETAVQQVDLIKIDVEGADLEVLNGAYQTLLANQEIIILMEVHQLLGVDPLDVAHFLEELGFNLYQLDGVYTTPIQNYESMAQFVAYR